MRRNEPSLKEGLEDYYSNVYWRDCHYDESYWPYGFEWLYESHDWWEWWLEQVDYDAVNEVLGEDYLY